MIRLFHYAIIGYVIFLTFLLWLPDPRTIVFGWQPKEDVAGYSHLITFAILGILVEIDRRRYSFEFLCLILLFYAIFTEIGQICFPPRSFELNDIIQNFAGIIIGMEIGNIIKNTCKTIIRFCNGSRFLKFGIIPLVIIFIMFYFL
ncbi:MAG: VanZ family protein [Planctomycetaceae bacterium]|jgi:hypothetical protein|nr:VanZ family protein [Planctomycetaceae bacterium]